MKAALALLLILLVASFAPVLKTDLWWIRFLDFPRLQLAIAVVILGVVCGVLARRWPVLLLLVALGCLAAVAYQASRLAPFLPFASPETITAAACPPDARLSILIANVKRTNRQADALFDLARDSDPDLFLAMETDSWWDETLDRLRPEFATQIKQVAGADAFFGIHLFSQLPLEDPTIRFLLDDAVPSIFATVRLADGAAIDFTGLHPRPPHPFQPATGRDAQLYLAAARARDSEHPAILAGDLNAVPWERTFERVKRIGRFLDPRVGRGLYSTYNAELPGVAWPLDHVIAHPYLVVVAIERSRYVGSDHYPLLVELCHMPELADRQRPPNLLPDDLEQAAATIGRAKALKEENGAP